MSKRGWILFSAMALIWGVPYLLIKVAVEEVSPPVVVATRTGLAALVLVPLAAHRGALRPVIAVWRPLLAFTIIEMGVPWLLLTHAEERLASSLAGLLVAAVPLIATMIAFMLGDRGAAAPSRLVGLVLGIGGVALVVGAGRDGSGDLLSVAEVLLVAVAYAVGPFILTRWLADVPPLGVVASSLAIVAVGYLPATAATWPEQTPPADALWALAGLAILCTGIAFLVFFALIAEVGPDRATLFTFVNPAVAVALGVALLDEPLTVGLLAGFPLVLIGCWLASRPRRAAEEAQATTEPLLAV